MSTKIGEYFVPYLIQSKRLSFNKGLRQLAYKALTDLRVSKTGRAYLYGSRTSGEVLKHVRHRLDASNPYNW